MEFKAKAGRAIGLIGIAADPVLQAVARQLEIRKAPYFIFDQNRFPGACSLTYAGLSQGVFGYLEVDGRRYDLRSIKSSYVRLLGAPSSGAQGRFSELEGERFLALDDLTRIWDVPTIGKLGPCASNFSKPYQISLLGSKVLHVPKTLVTSNPRAILKFQKQMGSVSFKSISSERSICMKWSPRWRRRLPLVRHLPVQFQEYIEGLDIRAHVAGDFVAALSIETGASDYRYSQRYFGIEPKTQPFELPALLCQELVRITRRLGLVVSGIDLRLTPDGRYFCFEVNPTPGFSYFDPEPQYPIANAIADLLMGKTYV